MNIGMNIGYARVSTDEQNLELQLHALTLAGCDSVFEDHGVSGAAIVRPAARGSAVRLADPQEPVFRLRDAGGTEYALGAADDVLTITILFGIVNIYTKEIGMSTKEKSRAAISFRVDPVALGLIDRAADIAGKNRTEFMVEAAAREAEAVLLDRRVFQLDAVQWSAFEAALNAPAEPNERLVRMMQSKPRWGAHGKKSKNNRAGAH